MFLHGDHLQIFNSDLGNPSLNYMALGLQKLAFFLHLSEVVRQSLLRLQRLYLVGTDPKRVGYSSQKCNWTSHTTICNLHSVQLLF